MSSDYLLLPQEDLNIPTHTSTIQLQCGGTDTGSNNDEDSSSVDEALLEMLGITSFHAKETIDDDFEKEQEELLVPNNCHLYHDSLVSSCMPNDQLVQLKNIYQNEAICIFPKILSILPQTMRRLTDEIVYGSTKYTSDRSYESIQYIKNGTIGSRRVLTRLENFVTNHEEWR